MLLLLLLLGKQASRSKLSPAYQRLTFDEGMSYSAPNPDGSIVYGAAGSHKSPKPR